MAKLFAKKYKYELDANQELFAFGFGNLFSAFFHGFPSCVGLSRSVILDGVGAKTQVCSMNIYYLLNNAELIDKLTFKL
jgi:MFS superfamily sulfate permease-like transporter